MIPAPLHDLSGYGITEVLHESASTVVYRGYRDSDRTPVIIKLLKAEYPTLREIARFKHEYSITAELTIAGIVKPYALIQHGNGLALILEDFGGRSLRQLINTAKLSLIDLLKLSIQLANSLGELHRQQIIHKDIKPQNIIINPDSGQVKLTDFSIASLLVRDNSQINPLNSLEGTLSYMSPEQTGRMNRAIDYRTDLYSLGITLYELLTGHLPFQSTDPMELVHSHIAKNPIPPHQVDPAIPPVLSKLVMKLLSKMAEDRYQSAFGLKADLETCLRQLETTGELQTFPLAQQDQWGQFHIPEKLYGREAEVAILLSAFARVCNGPTELILIEGYSGIGKSTLVNEVQKPIVRQRGYFSSGKFDQFKRNIPYASLVQAFQELIRQLLTEDDEQIARWRAKLQEALGENGQVIAEVIPELELIIGKQPPVLALNASESQNRFNLVFRQFINVFTAPEHPLVLFLDDLQWADAASLNLIQLVLTDPASQHLLMIGAYRDNEVSPTHPLMLTLDAMQQALMIQTITLQNLGVDHVNQLVADALNCTVEAASPLATLLFHKTQGNPFFLTQLLESLYHDQLLTFDFQKGRWNWDIDHIQQQSITDNVVDFMVQKIQTLPEDSQSTLQLAACIGNQFELQTLATISQKSASAIALDLWTAIQAGLILPVGDAYKMTLAYAPDDLEQVIAERVTISYRFLHDRVQQAAYVLIPMDQKQSTHLTIGRSLLRNTKPEQLSELIFDIVNSLNIGAELINDSVERNTLAALNLMAGQKAKSATAYETALKYFLNGIGFLADDCWQHHYELTLTLHLEAAEAAYLTTQYGQSEALVHIVEQRATHRLDRAKAYALKIQFHMAQLQMTSAINAGLDALKLLEVPLVKDSLLEQEDLNWIQLPALESLNSRPEMTDAYQLAALHLLRTVTSPAYQAQPDTFRLLVLTQVNFCIENGHSAPAAFAYVAYGWLMCGKLGQFEVGYHAGQIALHLLDQFHAKSLQCSVYQIFESFIRPWKEHLRATFRPLIAAIKVGQETGDVDHTSYCVMNYCTHLFLSGEPLEKVSQKQQGYIDLLSSLKQEFQLYYTRLWYQLVLNLQDVESNRHLLKGKSFDEDEIVPRLRQAENHQSLFAVYVAKLILAYLFKEDAQAIAAAQMADKYAESGAGLALTGSHYFYYALALLAHCHSLKADKNDEQEDYHQQAIAILNKMKTWAHHAPANYQHKCELIEAELARVEENWLQAMDCYDLAIQHAREQQYTQEEAIANERAADFYATWGKTKIAHAYLVDAYYAYVRWGAIAKVKELEEQYPQLVNWMKHRDDAPLSPFRSTTKSSTTSTSSHSGVLDLSTVLKASQALSSEIVLSNLLETLMRIAIENAGAQRGIFMIQREGEWLVEAEGTADGEAINVLQSMSLKSCHMLPLTLINYVMRTRNCVVLDDAMRDDRIVADPYITENQVQSVLCFPILHHGQLSGILYLENNLTTGAFTPERLEVLKILTAQISISIENALLYTNLQSYSKALEMKSEELEAKNEALQHSERREREKAQEVERSLQQLKQTQAQLVQTEKISSLGQLVAGVAHEVNNPVGFISGNLKYAQNYVQDLVDLLNLYQQELPQPSIAIQEKIEDIDLEYLLEDLPKLLASMTVGIDRIRDIMLSLRTFSRVDADQKQPAALHDGIDSTLLILQHRLKANSQRPQIQLVKQYGDLPLVYCYPGQLNQVFMNLIANAIDALDDYSQNRRYDEIEANPNVITVRTAAQDNRVTVAIADNGPGIPEAVQQRLFEPFFTTKAAGKGTGLGLSISHQIVTEKHGGRLFCVSKPGQGTEFILELPVGGKPAQGQARFTETSEAHPG